MALPHVSTGDPHVAAHNAERDAINSLSKGTIGLGNVDNTSDANKPVSTAQANAIKDRLTAQPIAAGVDLNSLTTSGNYYQGSSSYATLALNYPEDGFAGYLEIVSINSTFVKQTYTYIALGLYAKTFNKYERVKYGPSSWLPWVVVPTLEDSLGQSYGVGAPNGVVSANSGSTYIDTAATNGAQQWVKKTGTGNTGWEVSVGDTGWRDVTNLITWTGGWEEVTTKEYRVKRVNNHVFYSLNAVGEFTADVLGSAKINGSNVTPYGFRPELNNAYYIRTLAGDGGRASIVVALRMSRMDTSLLAGVPTSFRWNSPAMLTSDPWPATLPGDPI